MGRQYLPNKTLRKLLNGALSQNTLAWVSGCLPGCLRWQLPPWILPWKEQAFSVMGAEGMPSLQGGFRVACVLKLLLPGRPYLWTFPGVNLLSKGDWSGGDWGAAGAVCPPWILLARAGGVEPTLTPALCPLEADPFLVPSRRENLPCSLLPYPGPLGLKPQL